MVHKIFIILWKDLLMRKNHYISTTVEVLLPIGLILLTNLIVPKQEREIDNDPISFETFKDNHCVPRHSYYGNVIYEPSTPFTDTLMSKAACYAGYRKSSVKKGKLNDTNSYYSVGVHFEGISESTSNVPDFLNYTLYPTDKIWLNVLAARKFSGSVIPRYSVPMLHNVIELQRAIDVSYSDLKNITSPQLNLKNTDLFERNPRIFFLAIYFALFVSFSLMIPAFVKRIIQEKFTGAKELMLMMGVVRWQLWVAKFLDVILFSFISVTGMVIFLYVPLKEDSNVLNVSPFLFWGIIMYGLISVIFFLFFLCCFFEKGAFAVYITEIIWGGAFFFSNILSSKVELPIIFRYFMCLFPHVALMNAISIILDFDFYDKTVKFTEKLSEREHALTLLNVLLMMALDIFLYFILTWYLDRVKPGKYGVPQPYNFCFKKSYWIANKVITSHSSSSNKELPESFEHVPSNLKPGVSIQNVTKVFKSVNKGVVTAVDNITIDFYHGEISALLGHNGAGKTTVFSMITGLSYPNSGRVLINGYDMGVNVCEARNSLGLCPQQDMLFDDLTTIQILKFFGVIKGLTWGEARKEACVLISKLKLENVKNTQACKLSGGQKRKVSLAIALIGGSEVLVLDEPTSGMDPEIRREIWEILLKFRGTRTILLTTHFMEEADALCDRIAIMDHGKIKCYGSTMFLKSKYGRGYILNVVVADTEKGQELIDYIRHYIPEARLKSQNIRTFSFELPESQVDAFPPLLSGLEEKQKTSEINSYCISIATLEDVFLRLSGHARESFDGVDSPRYKKLDINEDGGTYRTSGYFLYVYQFWVLMVKKWIYFVRCYKSFLLIFVIQAVIIIVLAVLSENRSSKSQPVDLSRGERFTYSLNQYPQSLVFWSNQNGSHVKTVFEEFIGSLGVDVKEVPNIAEALYEIFKDDFYTYARKVNLAFEFLAKEINIFHNRNAVHILPISLNLIHNLWLKLWNENATISTSVDVKYANKEFFRPLPPTGGCLIEDLPDLSGVATMFYLFGPIKERIHGAKEIQLMITPTAIYWLSHLVFDLVSLTVYVVVVSSGVGLVRNDEFMLRHGDEIFLSVVLWGAGLLLVCYVISTFVKNLTGAFSLNIIIYVVFAFAVYDIILFDGLPNFFQYLHPNTILKFGYSNLCAGKDNGYLWALLLLDSTLFVFLILKDSGLISRLIHQLINKFINVNFSADDQKDEFVKEEERLVKKYLNKENFSDSVLIAEELKRWYWKGFRFSPAVRGISFAVSRGECFGLLGVNGAGKTSTFRMLAGSLSPSHGNTYVCPDKLSFFNRQKYLFSIGYCPQFGGLIPSFKGRELLAIFARLRGICKSSVDDEVQKWLEKLDLLEYANQKCGSYSGGNQRKLSTAIALIGDCPLIFLDEPTSGVDPLSRLAIWNAIGDVQREGQSLVLTSHSMDECEALCSRLAIMVSGRFRCLGETTTLKDRFGQGYCVQLKITAGAPDEELCSLRRHVASSFEPGCELIDEHLTILQYHVTNKSLSWAEVFTKLKMLKEKFRILESYTASATTLEQIFIYFARNQ